jgi:hypothetical protein
MNVLASIKSEKKMSLKHWRFRILHWCFNEDWRNWDSYKESDLPEFLYTHYCPLFHLTNLIGILAPLIFGLKLGIAIIFGIIKCCGLICDVIGMLPWDKVGAFLDRLNRCFERAPKPPREKSEASEEEVQAERLKDDKKKLLARMLQVATHGDSYSRCSCEPYGVDDFERFWRNYDIRTLPKEQAEAFYVTRMAKIIETQRRVKERKEKMRQRLIFWTNFSQVFLKWFFNICYIALAIFVFWALFKITPPVFFFVVDFVKLLFTFDVLPFLIWVGIWLVRFLVVVVPTVIVIYGFVRFEIVQKCGVAMGSSIMAVSPPFVLVAQWFVLPFIWGGNGICNTIEFVKMFYEENCPPITIISGEEEMIATELNEAE